MALLVWLPVVMCTVVLLEHELVELMSEAGRGGLRKQSTRRVACSTAP